MQAASGNRFASSMVNHVTVDVDKDAKASAAVGCLNISGTLPVPWGSWGTYTLGPAAAALTPTITPTHTTPSPLQPPARASWAPSSLQCIMLY